MAPTATAPDPNLTVWFAGKYTRLADAQVNILTHALNYGTAVFEGIRGYYDADTSELYLNRALDHYQRWKANCGILRLNIPHSAEELCAITAELCRRNQFRTNIYIRPLAYKASARIGVHSDNNDAHAIVAVPFGDYFAAREQFKAGVVSWRRVDDLAIPSRAKISGAYANSVLAGDEAAANGHDEAIFLNQDGHVAEGGACNIFLARHGRLITPPVTDNILEGITRDSIIELARHELGVEVVERPVDRSELYICDEVFFCGTGVEILPVTHVDHRPVRDARPGAITVRLREMYRLATRGKLPAYRHWLQPTLAAEAVRA
ncbi:MAG TPA: branched-chain amino acid transaminase [Terriglobales bacterium]|nr:branched-chain amino acid transaminase [Terriglobales bacterium]